MNNTEKTKSKDLIEKSSTYRARFSSVTSENSESEVPKPVLTPSNNPMDKLYMKLKQQQPERSSTQKLLILKEETKRYEEKLLLDPVVSFKEFWSREHNRIQLKKIFKVALRSNTMCDASVPCESIFSIAGYKQRQSRGRKKFPPL